MGGHRQRHALLGQAVCEIIARVVAGLEPPPEGDLLVVSLVKEVGPGTVECVVARLGVLGREEAAQQAYE